MSRFEDIPGRLLIDTCIVMQMLNEGAYLFEGELPPGCDSELSLSADLRALRRVMSVIDRACFELKMSPLTLAEIANQQRFESVAHGLTWAMSLLDHWLITLDESGDRKSDGGRVQHRFKLNEPQQALERALLDIPDLRKDPFDRLLLIESTMAQCDAFLTLDRHTIHRNRERLSALGIRVLTPVELWSAIEPFSGLWH